MSSSLSSPGGAGGESPSTAATAGTLEAPEYLPISFLNALLYCPRRFYYEYAWGEMLVNEHVLEGRIRHRTADAGGTRTDEDGITRRRVYVYSERLRVSGLIDVMEARGGPEDDGDHELGEGNGAGDGGEGALDVAGVGERTELYPVEYKKGSKHGGGTNDHVQLCAQGMCLEERTGRPVAGGYVFSFASRHRTWIPFTAELRALTEAAIAHAFALLRAGRLPPPLPAEQDRKCRACSLEPLCLPREVRALAGRDVPGGVTKDHVEHAGA